MDELFKTIGLVVLAGGSHMPRASDRPATVGQEQIENRIFLQLR